MFAKLVTSFQTVDVLIATHSLKVCIARVAIARQSAQIVPLATDLKMVSARRVRPRLVLSVISAQVDAMHANQECLLTNLASVCLAKPRAKSAEVLISALSVSERCTVWSDLMMASVCVTPLGAISLSVRLTHGLVFANSHSWPLMENVLDVKMSYPTAPNAHALEILIWMHPSVLKQWQTQRYLRHRKVFTSARNAHQPPSSSTI